MGILDSVVNSLGGVSGIEADLMQLSQTFGNNGLQNIVGQLQSSGLDQQVQSWIGGGANLPVDAGQLQAALGDGKIGEIARSLGIDPTHVASVLPQLINHVTPNGQIPHNLDEVIGNLSGGGGLGALIGGFLEPRA